MAVYLCYQSSCISDKPYEYVETFVYNKSPLHLFPPTCNMKDTLELLIIDV